MKIYQIRQNSTDAILWTGSADSEEAALQAMAHEAGYVEASKIPEEVRAGGLTVEHIGPTEA